MSQRLRLALASLAALSLFTSTADACWRHRRCRCHQPVVYYQCQPTYYVYPTQQDGAVAQSSNGEGWSPADPLDQELGAPPQEPAAAPELPAFLAEDRP